MLKLVCPIVSVQWAYGWYNEKKTIYLFSYLLYFKLENQNSKYSDADCKCQRRRQAPAQSQQ